MSIFMNRKMKRVPRPQLIEGMNPEEFIRINADRYPPKPDRKRTTKRVTTPKPFWMTTAHSEPTPVVELLSRMVELSEELRARVKAVIESDGMLHAIALVRRETGAGLAEAKTLVEALAPRFVIKEPEIGTIWVFDPRTQAVAGLLGSHQPLSVLRALLGRPPSIDRPGFVSWGKITRPELEAMARADYLSLEDEELLISHPPETALWALVMREH